MKIIIRSGILRLAIYGASFFLLITLAVDLLFILQEWLDPETHEHASILPLIVVQLPTTVIRNFLFMHGILKGEIPFSVHMTSGIFINFILGGLFGFLLGCIIELGKGCGGAHKKYE